MIQECDETCMISENTFNKYLVIIWTISLWKCLIYRHLHEGMYGERHKVFTLYLRSPCLAVNNTTFATRIFLKYMPSVLAIIPGNVSKISNVFHRQCTFYEKFNIPTVFKDIQKWWSHKNERRTMFSFSYSIWLFIIVTKCSFLLKQLMYGT